MINSCQLGNSNYTTLPQIPKPKCHYSGGGKDYWWGGGRFGCDECQVVRSLTTATNPSQFLSLPPSKEESEHYEEDWIFVVWTLG